MSPLVVCTYLTTSSPNGCCSSWWETWAEKRWEVSVVADLNLITLTGVSTRDAKLRQKSGGQVKAEFSLEVERPFYRATGEPVSDLFLVDAWNDLARWVADNITEGRRLFVIGTLNKESYNTRGGREHLTIVKAKYVRTLDGQLMDEEIDLETLKADYWPLTLLQQTMGIVGTVLDEDSGELELVNSTELSPDESQL